MSAEFADKTADDKSGRLVDSIWTRTVSKRQVHGGRHDLRPPSARWVPVTALFLLGSLWAWTSQPCWPWHPSAWISFFCTKIVTWGHSTTRSWMLQGHREGEMPNAALPAGCFLPEILLPESTARSSLEQSWASLQDWLDLKARWALQTRPGQSSSAVSDAGFGLNDRAMPTGLTSLDTSLGLMKKRHRPSREKNLRQMGTTYFASLFLRSLIWSFFLVRISFMFR